MKKRVNKFDYILFSVLFLLISIFTGSSYYSFTGNAIKDLNSDYIPGNENVLCVYNINSVLSTQVCEYYLSKRPGSNSLGLNLPEDSFIDNFKEVMHIDNATLHIINPIYDYVESHQELTITHLAIAKDIPFVVVDPANPVISVLPGNVRQALMPYIAHRYRYNSNSSFDVGANSSLIYYSNFSHSYRINSKHFNPEHYKNSSGGYTIRFVGSHLQGFSFDDIKHTIDVAVTPIQGNLDGVWYIDTDSDRFSVTDYDIDGLNDSLINRGYSGDEIFVETSDNKLIRHNKPILGYYGPGTYHPGFHREYVTDSSIYDVEVYPRAIYGVIESFAAYTASGDPSHTSPGSYTGQSLIADALASNAFGGSSYSNSFAGMLGPVEEPGQGGLATSLRLFFMGYSQGLTLAESNSFGTTQRSPLVSFGDPLLRISDDLKIKESSGGYCSKNYDCISGVCSLADDGEMRCGYETKACLFFNSYKWDRYENGYSSCINSTAVKICNNGFISVSSFCSNGYQCSMISGVPTCLKSLGTLCSSNSECGSNSCSLDIRGNKRCSVNGYCIASETENMIGSGSYYCLDDNSRAKCTSGSWGSIESGSQCSQGFFGERNYFDGIRTFNLLKDQSYYVTLPVDVTGKKASQVFSNIENGFSLYLFRNNSFQSFNYYFGEFNRDPELISGEGVYLFFSKDTSLNVLGDLYQENPSYNLVEGYNLIGLPYCGKNYTASAVIKDLNSQGIPCSRITKTPIGGPNEYWSLDPNFVGPKKKDFVLNNYESYYLICSEDTVWKPICNPDYNAPSIISSNIINNSYVKSNFSYLFTLSEKGFAHGSLSRGIVNFSLNKEIDDKNFNYDFYNLIDGPYTLTLFTQDTWNNTFEDYKSFNVDGSAPIIEVLSYNISDSLYFNVSISDINLQNIWYIINGTRYDRQSNFSLLYSVFGPGNHSIQVYANDSLGNTVNYTYYLYVPMHPQICVPGVIVSCDDVDNGEVTGYKAICNADGYSFNSNSTCSVKCDKYFSYVDGKCITQFKKNLKFDDFNFIEKGNKVNLIDKFTNLSLIEISDDTNLNLLNDIVIERQEVSASKAFLFVRNISLDSGKTKTLYLPKLKSSSNAICFVDSDDILSLQELNQICVRLPCPGEGDGYSCSIMNDSFKITGLRHSSLTEDRIYCGDNRCDASESCSTCSQDCNCSNTGTTTGGTTGGSSGGSSGSSGGSSGGSSSGSSGSTTGRVTVVQEQRQDEQILQNDGSIKLNPLEIGNKSLNPKQILYIILGIVGFMILVIIVLIIINFRKNNVQNKDIKNYYS